MTTAPDGADGLGVWIRRRRCCAEDMRLPYRAIARCHHGRYWDEGAPWGERQGESCWLCLSGQCESANVWTKNEMRRLHGYPTKETEVNDLLTIHFERVFDETVLEPKSPRVFNTLAKGIRADPQAHVDALVAADVIEVHYEPNDREPQCYRVVKPKPPHVHEWRVAAWTDFESVPIGCLGCAESRLVVNLVPIDPEATYVDKPREWKANT